MPRASACELAGWTGPRSICRSGRSRRVCPRCGSGGGPSAATAGRTPAHSDWSVFLGWGNLTHLPADVALVVEAVGEDVHGEGGHADVHLAAHAALLGGVVVEAEVGLLVSAQVAASRVVLAAFSTLILRLVHVEQAVGLSAGHRISTKHRKFNQNSHACNIFRVRAL